MRRLTSDGPRLAIFCDFSYRLDGETLTAEHAKLRAWLGRINARPSMIATTWERVAAMAQAA